MPPHRWAWSRSLEGEGNEKRRAFRGDACASPCYAGASGEPMKMRIERGLLPAPATKRWSRSRERGICPRRHLRVLPIRTRPSLFGGD